MDDEENADIAAAMGFASFGGTKKRKYDHTTNTSPKAKPDASGANSTKLGVRSKKVAGAQDVDIENPSTASMHQTPQHENNPPGGRPKKPQPADSGLAISLARGQNLAAQPSTVEGTQAPAASVDAAVEEMMSFGGAPVSRTELTALRNGVRTEEGDTAYFLPSFVEDPWGRLRGGGRG